MKSFEGKGIPGRTGLASSFSVVEAQRLMAAVPADVANDVWRTRCAMMHTHFRSFPHVGQHPVVHRAPGEQARLLRAMARCVRDTKFAEMCLESAAAVVTIEGRLADEGRSDEATRLRALMIGMPMEWVVQVWRFADRMDELRARQKAWGRDNHRIARALRSAHIPLWAVDALGGISIDDLRVMTPSDLLHLAGREEVHLTEAAHVLDRLRVLALLGVEPAEWNDLLDSLTVRFEATDGTQVSRVEEVAVPPHPCHPPGALVLAEPRIPRAPGHVVPRRITPQGRRRLHHVGGRGGRLTV
ncbi:hypothetical protein C0R01_31370 [Streptomyces albidoflavus]|nr:MULTISPECIES: hypothetical protein [Streptomyces]QHV83527.1 hypothetical protein C3K23_00625 [Streptomyces sp. 604F]RZE60437.1 hypothetical protein C0R00_22925 [Streptomyces albidoflavus]RZE66022.1 hypothetical protein C0R01_31370 [Streptomyces albidoflavus]